MRRAGRLGRRRRPRGPRRQPHRGDGEHAGRAALGPQRLGQPAGVPGARHRARPGCSRTRTRSPRCPIDRVTVQLRGRIRTHDVQIELEAVPDLGSTRPIPTDGPATQYLLEFTNAERRILTALCEPLLTARGDQARPASYAQAAERLFLSRSRVENCIADLVKKYASAGVPGLEGPEAKDNLCRYAVRSGSISQADLEHIP